MNPYLKKCFLYLRKPFVSFPILHCHPYSWQEKQPTVNTNRWARAHWYLNSTLVSTYSAFVLCRIVHVCLINPVESLIQKFYMAFVSQLYLLEIIAKVSAVTTRNEFVPFLRRYIGFLEKGTGLN